jgi:polysaccharide export outer membrane protein
LSADNRARRSLLRAFFAFMLIVFSAVLPAQEAAVDAAKPQQESYRLGPTDVIIVTVHNHEDLSGTFQLDGSGLISMSLIGQVEAAGLTTAELETRITNKLKPDYLVNPRVTVRVQNYRPYYLIGEASSTGAFNFRQGMTFMEAIAIAGGYSYRAKKGVVFVKRGGAEDEVEMDVHEKVQPGDIIRIAERLF